MVEKKSKRGSEADAHMSAKLSEAKTKQGPIIFYCKDCEEIVDTNRFGRKYVYKCKKCGTKNVAFGTEKSIYTFFRLAEAKPEARAEGEAEAKAEPAEGGPKSEEKKVEKKNEEESVEKKNEEESVEKK